MEQGEFVANTEKISDEVELLDEAELIENIEAYCEGQGILIPTIKGNASQSMWID